MHWEQGRRKHLKFGGTNFKGTSYLKLKGHFLKIKGVPLCLLQNFAGNYPHCPMVPAVMIGRTSSREFMKKPFERISFSLSKVCLQGILLCNSLFNDWIEYHSMLIMLLISTLYSNIFVEIYKHCKQKL